MMAKNTSATLAMKVALAGVILIPVIFAGFYLSAFLDPYAHLDQVPVAVVNNDEGATINDEERNLGDEVVQRLKDQPKDESLGWSFVSEKEAKQGMKDGTYYMICTLPKDFSEQIASADTSDPEKASIVVNYDESANMLASQIGENAWKQLVTKVNQSVVEEYFGTVFDKITDAGDDLQEAVDGALELYDGLADAEEGSGKITTNLYKLVDGSDELKSGLQKLSDGTSTLAAGANKLKDGTSSLESSTQQLSDGAKSLSSGATTALAGASVLNAGSAQLDEGTQTALAGAQKLQSGIKDADAGVSNAESTAQGIYAGLVELKGSSPKVDSSGNVTEEGSGLLAAQAGAKTIASKLSELGGTLANLLESLGKTSQSLSGAASDTKDAISSTKSAAEAGQSSLASAETALKDVEEPLKEASDAVEGVSSEVNNAKSSIEHSNASAGDAYSAISAVDKDSKDAKDAAAAAKSKIADASDAIDKIKTTTEVDGKEVYVVTKDELEQIKSAMSSAESNAKTAAEKAENVNKNSGSAVEAADKAQKDSKTALEAATSAVNAAEKMSKVTDASGEVTDAATAVTKAKSDMALNLDDAEKKAESAKKSADAASKTVQALSTQASSLGKLVEGANDLSDGLDEAVASLGSENVAGKTLIYASHELAGYKKTGDDGKETATGLLALKAGTAQLSAGIDQLVGTEGSGSTESTGMVKLASGATSIHAGLQQLVGSSATDDSDASGLTALAEGTGTLSNGMSQLNEATPTLVNGISQLAAGSDKLASSAPSAVSGAGQISSGASKLASGSSTLTDGLGTAKDGADELHDGLKDGVDQMSYTDKEKSDKKEQMSEPVELDEEYYTSVENYGTGFAPFFIALGVWVGAIFNCFLFRCLNSRLGLSGANPFVNAIASYLPMVCFSIASTIIAQAFVQFGLGAQVNNVVGYYGMGILTAMCFTAMVQFLVAAFGFPGRFIAVVVLTLQMTSAAGTFPIVMEPDFFNMINPLFPMTYVVEGMRQLMTGIGTFPASQDAVIIVCYGVVFFLLTVVVAWKKRHVTMADIHPLLDL